MRANLKPFIQAGVAAAGMKLLGIIRKPHRKSARYWVDYLVPQDEEPVQLKVDTHFLDKRFATDVQVVAGIRTYSVSALFEQKLAATSRRNQATDLFDLTLMATRLASSLKDSQILRLQQFISDPRRLDRRYTRSFVNDRVLRGITTYDPCRTAIENAVASEVVRRVIEHPEQRTLTTEPIFRKILAYHRRRAGENSGSPVHEREIRNRSRADEQRLLLYR